MNPPAAPVACDTCGAVAGARCRTGLGSIAVHIHAARARAVNTYYEGVRARSATAGVTSLDEWRHRRRTAHA